MTKITSSLVLAFLTASVHAQRPSPEELLDNFAELERTMTTNRASYLPGEDIHVTLRVRNPTAGPLVVPQIFDEARIHFHAFQLDAQGEPIWRDTYDVVPEAEVTETSPIETIQSGAERVWSGWISAKPVANFPVLNKPGTYSLQDIRLPAASNVTITAGTVEAVAEVQFPALVHVPEDAGAPAEDVPVYRRAYAIRSGGASYLCVGLDQDPPLLRIAKGAEQLGPLSDYLAMYYGPFRRFGSSANPITSISATMDANENLTVIWRDNTGSETRFDFDANLNPR